MAKEKKDKKDKKKGKAEKESTSKPVTQIVSVLDHEDDEKGSAAVSVVEDGTGRNHMILNNVRIRYPQVFDPPEYKGKPQKRNISVVFDIGEERNAAIVETLKGVCVECAEDKGLTKGLITRLKNGEFTSDNCALRPYAKLEGDWWELRANSNGPVMVIMPDGASRAGKDDEHKLYSGAYVNIKIDFWAMEGSDERVSCNVISVKHHRDGEALAGGVITEDDALAGMGASAADL